MKIIKSTTTLALIFLINNLIAQENYSNEISSVTSISTTIDANSKDEAIEDNIVFFKKEKNIDLQVKDIKRNQEGKITAINLSYNDNNGNSGSKQIKGIAPIKPITFIYTKDKNGDINFNISTNESTKDIIKKYHVSDVKFSEDELEMPKLKSSSSSKVTTITKDKDGKIKKSVIVNGEPTTEEEVIKIYKSGDVKYYSGADVKEIIEEIDINKIIKESTDAAFKFTDNLFDKNEIKLPNMKELEDQVKKLQEEMEKMKKEMEESKKELKNTKKI